MSWPINDKPEPPVCARCGQPAHVDWVDVTQLGDPVPMVTYGRTYCETPGCVGDRFAMNSVPWPPEPGELTRDDRAWIQWQQEMAGD